jgi:predicted nucleic acid-binding protein
VILLDTNVISELMQSASARHAKVTAFLAAQNVADLFLPSMAIAEIRYGIEQLPAGKRRNIIDQAFKTLLQTGFANRIINFDVACADAYATARAIRKRSGRPVAVEDALIGGIALAYGATLATRNTTDFDGYGLTLIDPWAG